MDVIRYHRLIRLAAALLVTLFFLLHSSGKLTLPLLDRLEAQAYDARVRFDLGDEIDPRIVIVDIDEASLREMGRWPWHRDQLAKMVDMLVGHYQVSLVGFDMVFVEPDDSSGLQVLRQLEQGGLDDSPVLRRQAVELRRSLQYDRRFAASLAQRPVVLGYFFQSQYSGGAQPSRVGRLPTPPVIRNPELPPLPLIEATGYGASLPLLQQAAYGGGFIDIPVLDADGVIRKVVLLQKFGNRYYPSLALAMMLALLENPPIELVVAPGYEGELNYGLEQIKLAEGLSIPVDEYGSALVPYRNHYPAFRYISATDVIHGRTDKALLENSIVLVGTTAAGLLDNRNTPVQSVHPGVEIHASLLSGMLDQALRHQPAYTRGVDMMALLLIAALLMWWLPRLGALGTLAVSGAMALLTVLGNYLLWRYGLIVLPLANQLGLIATLFVFYTSFGFFVEQRAKRILARRFGQYVPPEIVEEMSHDLGDYGLHGETRQMSVMFTDIRRFTGIADTLDPKELTQLMNTYLTAMTRVIHQHRGTIDKYIGDAIMAFWGAPLFDPIHPRHAVEAAFEMLDGLVKVNEQLSRWDIPRLEIGIGINSGEMNVGNMGSRFRMAYTVMGDTVNLASRFENLTKYYQVPIIVGESTKEGVADYEFRILDKVRFKGRDGVTTLYQPMGRSAELDDAMRQQIRDYHLALQAYYRQDWAGARSRFADLCRAHPQETLYRVYAERIEQLCNRPYDEAWDKVWVHDTVKEVLE
jgi:adenylate cyclase